MTHSAAPSSAVLSALLTDFLVSSLDRRSSSDPGQSTSYSNCRSATSSNSSGRGVISDRSSNRSPKRLLGTVLFCSWRQAWLFQFLSLAVVLVFGLSDVRAARILRSSSPVSALLQPASVGHIQAQTHSSASFTPTPLPAFLLPSVNVLNNGISATGVSNNPVEDRRRLGSLRFSQRPRCSASSPLQVFPSDLQRRPNAKVSRSQLRLSASEAGNYDYDVAIVGCGVGGHGAALHAVSKGLKTVVLSGGDVGGTCVNRGCVPSKALLAASGRVREMRNADHLRALGISVKDVTVDRAGVAAHAQGLANKVRGGLANSLATLGVEVRPERAVLAGLQRLALQDPAGRQQTSTITARDVILAPGSVPFVPKGIEVDEQTVFTSDGGLKLPFVPQWLAIVGSGYIGLEFADVFTALGSEVTFIEAMDKVMPTFDREIAKVAERLLIRPRPVEARTGVFASEVTCGKKGEKPVVIKLIDANTKEHVETMEVDACMVATGRIPNTKNLGLDSINVTVSKGGFVPVDDRMRVLNAAGELVPHTFCIGDANGKLMLAHAASAQGVSAVENISGRAHVVNHSAIPAACFTHPEIAFVGLNEEQAREKAGEEGFELGKVVSHFRGNSKALAEGEGEGIAKVLYRKDNEQLLGVHIIGMHASDLIQECSNAMAGGTTVRELSFMVHTHPTLSEVMDSAFKQAVGSASH